MILLSFLAGYVVIIFAFGGVIARRVYDHGNQAQFAFLPIDSDARRANVGDALLDGFYFGCIWPIIALALIFWAIWAMILTLMLGRKRR